MSGRLLFAVTVLAGAMVLGAPQALAIHCAAYHSTNLNLVIDYSGSMEGWRDTLARGVGMGVIDALIASGNLQRAGGIGFPSPPNFNLPVNEGNIYPLRSEVETTRASSSSSTPLYVATYIAASELARMPAGDTNILVIITDGEGDDHSWRVRATSEMLSIDAQKIFIYPSDVSSPGLEDFARETGSSFYTASAGDQAMLIDSITRRACANYAPAVSLSLSTRDLMLGDGRRITFDASGSSDRETASSLLEFEWRTGRVGEALSLVSTGTGPVGARFEPVYDETDIGDWQVQVTVLDSERARHSDSETFIIRGSPPEITFTATETITAGERLAVRVAVRDPDGGDVDWSGRIVSGPEGGAFPVDHAWTDPEISWDTTSADITHTSDGSENLADSWVFEVNANDDEGDTSTATVTVVVLNRAPEFTVTGPELVPVGENLSLEVTGLRDPDGGEAPVINWDIVQSPDADADGSTYPAQLEFSSEAVLPLPYQAQDGGSYLFRLTVTDDEGEEVSSDHPVLLSVPPAMSVTPTQVRIRGLTESLTLDGGATYDPDTPCPGPDYCHTNLDGAVTGVTEGLTRWTWSILDRPRDMENVIPATRVVEVLSLDDATAVLEIPPAYLEPGPWTFQLSATDGEGESGQAEVAVEVIAEGSAPIAAISAFPPSAAVTEHEVGTEGDFLWALGSDLTLSGAGSYDPDILYELAPSEAVPEDRGIAYYRWQLLPPAACTEIGELTAEGASLVEWTPLVQGDEVAETCWGQWTARLEVTDTDSPPETGLTEFPVDFGGCRLPICVLSPRSGNPLVVGGLTDKRAVISFLLGQSARALFSAGSRPHFRVEIFEQAYPGDLVNELEVPLHDLRPGSYHRVAWSGRWQNGVVKPGVYSYRLVLTQTPARPRLAEVVETNAIVIPEDPEGLVMDCAELWTGGFPDSSEPGAFPCVEHPVPAGYARAGLIRLFAKPGFVNDSWLNWRYLQWTTEAAMESLDFLSAWPVTLPGMNIIITEKDVPRVAAEAYREVTLAGERCPIMVRIGGLDEDRASFKQLVAHEIAHCLQYVNFFARGAGHRWWVEGSADWISSEIYPLANREHGNVAEYVHRESLFDQVDDGRYGTSIVFYALARDPAFGLHRVLGMLEGLAASDGVMPQAQALASMAGLNEAFHRSARAMRAGAVGPLEDRWPRPPLAAHQQRAYGTDHLSYAPPGDPAAISDLAGGVQTYTVEPFAVEYIEVYLSPGYHYRLVLEDISGAGQVSSTESTLVREGGEVSASSTWRSGVVADHDLRVCSLSNDRFTHLAATSSTPGGAPYQFRLRTEVLGGTGCSP